MIALRAAPAPPALQQRIASAERRQAVAGVVIAILAAACGPLEPDDATPEVDIPEPRQVATCDESSFDERIVAIDVQVALDDFVRVVRNEDPDLEVPVTVCVDGEMFHDAELELHGGASRTKPKKSFRLKFPDDHKVVSSVFGDAAQDYHRWVLQASWVDPSFMRNALTFMLTREQAMATPRTGFAALRINGAFYGLMVVIERIDRQFVRRHGFNPDGNLYKAIDHSADWRVKGDALDGYEHKVAQGDGRDLRDLLEAVDTGPYDGETYQRGLEEHLDLDDFATWQLVHTMAMDRDTFTKNYYLQHDLEADEAASDRVIRIIPWDADATWGNLWDGRVLAPDDTRDHGGAVLYEGAPEAPRDGLSSRLMAADDYRRGYLERYRDLLDTNFQPAALEAQVRQWARGIRALAVADHAQWQPDIDFDAELERLVDVVHIRHDVMSEVVEERLSSTD